MNKFLLLIVSLFFAACSSDETTGISLSSSAQALADYDGTNYGLYKGIFVGSSGVVEINIMNDGELSAMMLIDNRRYNFSTAESVVAGQDINGLTFVSGNNSFDFNVSATGQNPQLSNINIPDHPDAVTEVVKEYSYQHIKCFQGNFSGASSGVFNMIQLGEDFQGIARTDGTTETRWISAQFVGETLQGAFEGGTFSGTLSGNTFSGTWNSDESESGTWTARRKL